MTQAFNLSQFANKVNTSGQADLTTAVTGALPVANGGTNQTTYTNGQLLIGNSTGNTLTKSTLTAGSGITITNGAGAITINATTAQIQTQLFTGPGTWTCPSTTTQVRVTVIGGGAGVSGGSGGTSSFGPAVSATGGSVVPATPGAGTVSVGTAIKTTGIVGTASVTTATPAPLIVASMVSFGSIVGRSANRDGLAGSPAFTYTTSLDAVAGAGGLENGGAFRTNGGGVAIAIVPVSAPVSITVGAGGASNPTPTTGRSGVGGAVLVEWVS